MVFTFIWNLSFIDKTFQVKHLMTGHLLDGGCLYRSTVVVVFFFNPATLMGPMSFCCWHISYVVTAKLPHLSLTFNFFVLPFGYPTLQDLSHSPSSHTGNL